MKKSIILQVKIDISEEIVSRIRASIDDESRKNPKIDIIFQSRNERKATCTSNQNIAFSNKGFNQEHIIATLMIIVFAAHCICWMSATMVNIIALAKTNSVPDDC